MRLYPKKLNNINDLERERSRLLKRRRKLEEDELLPGIDLPGVGKGKGKSKDKKDTISYIADLLPVSNPILGLLKNMVVRRLTAKDDSNKEATANKEDKKKGKGMVRTIAIEFIGGYLKWKAIELSYKGIKHLLKSRNKNTGG